MGTLTLTELKAELKAGLANRSDLDSRLTRILNLAQQRIARLHDFDEMEVISTSILPFNNVPADKYVTFPNLRELYVFKILDGMQSFKLTGLTPRLFNRQVPAPEEMTRNTPRIYTIWKNTAILFPVPHQAYDTEIWWTKWPTAFTDSNLTAVSDFENKDEVLIELSLVYAYKSLGKVEEAQKHWSMARGLLQEMVLTDSEKPDTDIIPGAPGASLDGVMAGEYWNDPFSRESP